MDSRTGPRIPSPLRFDRRRRVVFFLFSRYLRNLRPSFFRNQLNLAENTISSLPIFFFQQSLCFQIQNIRNFKKVSHFLFFFSYADSIVHMDRWMVYLFLLSCLVRFISCGFRLYFSNVFFFQQFHVFSLFFFQTMITHIVLLCHVTKVHKVSVLRGLLFYKVI